MAQHKRLPTEREKRQLTEAIDKDDTDTIQQIMQHDSLDVNAYINWRKIRWRQYTALHYAVDQNKINCVKLLIQLGASLTITDYAWYNKGRKTPLQRAVDKNRPLIVHYFVKEHNQDISELDQNYQSKVHSMIEKRDCIIAKENISSYYAELASLPITSFLPKLQSKGVITVEEKEKIRANPEETDRMQYLLDHVIVPGLDSTINKFKGFLKVMEESGDSELLSAAVKLASGLDVTVSPLPFTVPVVDPPPPDGKVPVVDPPPPDGKAPVVDPPPSDGKVPVVDPPPPPDGKVPVVDPPPPDGKVPVVDPPPLHSPGGTDIPDVGFDCYRLLWQELNKKFGNTPTKAFVMAVGQQISPFEYRTTDGNEQLAAQKTFELVNHTIPCATTYSPNGSSISGLWKRLLQEEGPKAGEEHRPAFEEAMVALFGGYDKSKHTDLYQDYIDKENALNEKKRKIKDECQKEYGDHWESNFNDNLQLSKEYTEFQHAFNLVKPHLDDIEVWQHGPLVHKLKKMEQVLKENAMSVKDFSGNCLNYFRVSLQPADWYQWFDPSQDENGIWNQINVDSKNDDADQAALYKKLGGSINTCYSLVEHSDVNISLKVRAVQISRPWLDTSILKNKNYTIDGEDPGSWSTGELNADNNGSFPLLTTQMIVAKDIKVTASTEMEHKAIIDTCSLFGVGDDSYDTIDDYSIKLKGAQIIGYACELLPKFPQ